MKPMSLYMDLGPVFDTQQILEAFYFALIVSYNIARAILVYIFISYTLFEQRFINNIFSKFFEPKQHHANDKNDIEYKIAFWWNNWIHSDDVSFPEEKNENAVSIPFLSWKQYENRPLIWNRPRQSILNIFSKRANRIKAICVLWCGIVYHIVLSVELFQSDLSLRLLLLVLCYLIPTFVWDNYLTNFINAQYLLYEFRTPRIQFILTILFYAIPTLVLLSPEIRQLFYDVLLPFINSYPGIAKKTVKLFTKATNFLVGVYNFWTHFGFGYIMLLLISAVADNWWDGNILPHFEKPGSTPVSTYILDSYRIRNTDKLMATYPYILLAFEIFGKYWYKIWEPRLYTIWRELRALEVQFQNPLYVLSTSPPYSKWDDVKVFEHTFDWRFINSFVCWINDHFNPEPFRIVGASMHLMYSSWPGVTGFLFALLFRGLRFRGPDTYPNFGNDIPDLPSRTPFLIVNKKYNYKKATNKKDKLRNEYKLIQFLPKASWQKYFVRWNWSYAFTISLLNNILYRGILKGLIGTASWKLITLDTNTMLVMRDFIINLEASLWFYGIVCCFCGLCPWFPLTNKACSFHVGRYYPIQERFRIAQKTPIILYPYDVLELKKAISAKFPIISLNRFEKIKIFIQIQASKIPRWFGLILLFFIGSYITIYITDRTFWPEFIDNFRLLPLGLKSHPLIYNVHDPSVIY